MAFGRSTLAALALACALGAAVPSQTFALHNPSGMLNLALKARPFVAALTDALNNRTASAAADGVGAVQ